MLFLLLTLTALCSAVVTLGEIQKLSLLYAVPNAVKFDHCTIAARPLIQRRTQLPLMPNEKNHLIHHLIEHWPGVYNKIVSKKNRSKF